MTNKVADVIIIGSGIAALIAADRISDEKNVRIITKSKKENSNSIRAQGGVAAAVSRTDRWESHFKDTVIAGSYHNNQEGVKLLVQKGPEMIHKLIDSGMLFDRDHKGKIHLGKEGAHSERRILHAGGDATGKALIKFLLNKIQSKVKICENEMAVDLLLQDGECIGVKTKDQLGNVNYLYADQIVLATGGCGGLYTFTSNDPSIIGDGIAMAYRAGAELADLEFIQFHPTMLCVDGEGRGLISEAVRGEGGILLTKDGKRLMEDVHPLKDLAPRDIVAREINKAVLNGNRIYLDISMIKDFEMRFPTISELCKKNGVDLRNGKIPVVPGAHFLMGGIKTNQMGETSIPHLYAVGEVTCTGVHGANRLASNSLLEGIVFANELAEHLVFLPKRKIDFTFTPTEISSLKQTFLQMPSAIDIKNVMIKHVGIVRTREGLEYAKSWFEQYMTQNDLLLDELSHHEIMIVNMLTTGWLITTSALMRTESRGGHYRSDYPNNEISWQQKMIVRKVTENNYSAVV